MPDEHAVLASKAFKSHAALYKGKATSARGFAAPPIMNCTEISSRAVVAKPLNRRQGGYKVQCSKPKE